MSTRTRSRSPWPSRTERCGRLGVIPNRPESIRKLVKKLGPAEQLRVVLRGGPDRVRAVLAADRARSALRRGGADAGAGEGGRSREDRSARRAEAGAELPRRRLDGGLGAGCRARSAAGSGAGAGGRQEGPAARAASAGQVPAATRPAAADRDDALDAGAPGVDQDACTSSTPAQEATLVDYLHEVEHVAERIERLESAIDEAVHGGAEPMRARDRGAAGAARGGAVISAVTIVAEVGELSRFATPRQLMGYSGAVSREALQRRANPTRRHHQDGQRAPAAGRRRSGVGVSVPSRDRPRRCASARRTVTPRRSRRSPGRRSIDCTSATGICWREGKCKQQVVTAVGRELLGFIWAIGVAVEGQRRRARARRVASVRQAMHARGRSSGGGRGAHGKENPRSALCGEPPGSTRALSPRQLPTDHDYAVSDPRISE